MPQTILQQIWDKTLEKLGEKQSFEPKRISEIEEALEENHTGELQTILSKTYENQETSN